MPMQSTPDPIGEFWRFTPVCHYGSLGEKAHRGGPAALKPPSTLVAREEKKDSKSREGVFFRKRKRGLQKRKRKNCQRFAVCEQ